MTDNKDALSALDAIVTAYCMGLGMEPPVPEAGSQTAQQVALIRAALTASPSDVSPDTDIWLKELRDALKYCDAEWRNCNANRRPAQLPIDHFNSLIWGAEKYLQTLPDAQGWRDISSAPRDGTHILVARKKSTRQHNIKRFVMQAFWSGRFKYWQLVNGGGSFDADIDGWQPLPSPPQTDGGKL